MNSHPLPGLGRSVGALSKAEGETTIKDTIALQ